LNGPSHNEYSHGLRHGADERTKAEEEESHEQDPFSLGDSEQLADEQDQATLGD